MQNRKQTLITMFIFLCVIFNYTKAQNAVAVVSGTQVPNGSFELPALSAGTFQYAPSGSGWTFSSTAGISTNGSPFTNCGYNTSVGNQVLILQNGGSASRITQIPSGGAYRLSIKAAQRTCANSSPQVIRVSVNGISIGQILPLSVSYQTYTTTVYWLNAGNHELKLEGISTTGDNTAFVDDVRWELIPRWSQTSTWQGGVLPTSSSTATIPAGYVVALDAVNALSKIVNVHGKLIVPANVNFGLSAQAVHVHGGLLEIGQESIPYTGTGKITLIGSNPSVDLDPEMGSKFLGAMMGGQIELHGISKKSWTQLNATANAGSTSITIKESVNWQVGDRIVIASTDFDMNKAEERTITAVSSDQKTFTLNQGLTHKHFGQLQSYSSINGESWSVDERAEVGLLSRNLIIEGDLASSNLAFGGHIMIMNGSVAHIENVELNRMGQRKKLGRYPFHWHRVGNGGTGQYFRNSSVHHTFNRAITVHSTNNTQVNNNVCYDNLGHAIFMEDGNETGNTITGNLGLVTRRPSAGQELLPSDLSQTRNASGPSTFWITHPSNIVKNNSAAGSDGSGFWFAFHQNIKSSDYNSGITPNTINLTAGNIDNNTAHSNYHGWLVGMAPVQGDSSQTTNFNNDYMPTQPVTVTGLIIFKNKLGMYSRIGGDGTLSTYIRMIVADNWEGDANTWVSEIKQSLWVGASQNYEPIPTGISVSGNGEGLVIGHVLYDGPCKIYNSHFAGFDRPNFSLFDQWGANIKYHGHSLHNTTVANGSYNVQFRNNYTGPVWFNASITDVDGTFTGTPMTAILQDHPMLIDATCKRITPGLRGMESNKRFCYIEVRSSEELFPVPPGQENNKRPTTQLLRNDGVSFIEGFKEIEGVSLSLMVNGVYQYKYIYHKGIPAITRFDYHSMNAGEWVILEIPNVPSTAFAYTGSINGFYGGSNLVPLPRVNTLAALQSYNGNAAAYIGNSLYLRYQAIAIRDFREHGVIGSLFLCLNGNCANGTSAAFPDTDGDGLTNVVETISSPFFVRSDDEVNDLSFDFTNGFTADWTIGDIEADLLSNNQWLVRAYGNDPQFVRSGFNIDGNKVKYIDIRTMCQATGDYQLFWTTSDDNTFSESKSVKVNYPVANTWEVLRFQVGDHPLWKNKTIKSLRIDPLGVNGVHTWLDWIKAKNTWIFAINKTGGTNTTVQRFDGGGNEAKIVTSIGKTVLPQTDNTWSFDLTDWNSDGYTDIAAFKRQATGSGKTEIHVLDGKTNYMSFLFQSSTALDYLNPNDHICLADYNGDKMADIWFIAHNASGSSMTEVHILDGTNLQSFLLHQSTGLMLKPNSIDDFCVYDYDGDKRPDLWYIQKVGMSGKTEVHILKNTTDMNSFKTFSANIATTLVTTNINWSFEVADYNRDGTVDVVGINRVGSNGKTDVHVLNGATSYQNFLLQVNTDMPTGTANYLYLVDEGTRSTGLGYSGARNADELSVLGMITESDEVIVYPNPARNKVLMNLGKHAGKSLELKVTSVTGSVFISRSYDHTDDQLKLSLEDLNSGVYIIQLNFPGNTVIQKKLVVTK